MRAIGHDHEIINVIRGVDISIEGEVYEFLSIKR